jgi:hypothetical protein
MKQRIGVIGVALLLGTSIAAAGCGNHSNHITTPTTAGFNGGNSASSKSASGLSLSLSLDSTTYQPGQQVTIVIDETNTLSKTNRVYTADKWPLTGLSVSPCGTLNYPFGVSIFQGNYTTANVSSAMPLTLFYPSELHGCPFILSGINSYVFQPLNDVAAIYQISNIEPFIEKINKEVQTTGLTDADPGVYSVVAGDEWGDLVIVHFTVSNMAGTTTSTNTPE